MWFLFVKRRETHEPIAYITGQKEFYGRPFHVDRNVLIPRPSTESLIDAVKAYLDDPKDSMEEIDTEIIVYSKKLQSQKPVILADIGTGSGCIAITLALEYPDQHIIATDISEDALKMAKVNAKHHHMTKRVTFKKGSGLEPLSDVKEPFLLISNPPYIPANQLLMNDVQDFEPHMALFAGEKGTDVLEILLDQAKKHKHCVGVVIECRTDQRDILV